MPVVVQSAKAHLVVPKTAEKKVFQQPNRFLTDRWLIVLLMAGNADVEHDEEVSCWNLASEEGLPTCESQRKQP